ncbi:potassium transporter Kup [Paraconexibacter antarcticus]|uniref:Probable potassium transport system protein Kup n=1 Tax=Paraconexibacter antarcticus TaxID=2949664 RepID=A0ABY5DQG5_9ACTN|nr:potassium transporter Kup [Paraconexibacter antarcticus]UTI64265.1 potassium transporter Kup [Paraconexibacter antarcticus]
MADPASTEPDPHAEGSADATAAGAGHGGATRAGMAALTLGALGVVFGDIGTSPLYAVQTVFHADHHAVKATSADVYGVLSLMVWSLTVIVSVKYVLFVMRADNEGEGGIMALIAQVQELRLGGRARNMVLVALGIFGAALFYGDGMITPAISVLSAVEGLKVVSPSLHSVVIPITLVVLTLLFSIQRFGTGVVGRLFGPVMLLWFAILAVSGLAQIGQHPGILRVLSPTYGAQFFLDHGGTAFIAMGSIVLAVTGAEALFADMGHFGREPIRRAWFGLVFPALMLNYIGQGALIIHTPSAIDNPFFLLVPQWGRVPMVLLATVATVIASQSMISGAFAVTRQAVQLGFLPRLTIRHTSEHEVGQVYVPAVNWGLFVAVVAIVAGFGSSEHLASAYGIAVTGTFVLTTILFSTIAVSKWRVSPRIVVPAAAAMLTVDLTFFSANLTKVVHGGWLPLVIAALVFTVLITWQRGRMIVTDKRTEIEGPLQAFIDEIHAMDPPPHRVEGTAVFLNANLHTTPLALRANVEHNHTLHAVTVVLSIQTLRVPYVHPEDRITIDDLGYGDDGITHITARFGFQDEPDVPATLRLAAELGVEGAIDVAEASYFLSRITIRRTHAPGMRQWRKRLFIGISRNAASPVAYFGLPEERTVTMGSAIDV